jgi:hypothetical protein
MGRIQVNPQEVERVGGQVVSVACGLGDVQSTMRGLEGSVAEPTATATALNDLTNQWTAGLARLEEDVISLGRAGQIAGFLYTLTDDKSIPISPPPGS